MKKALGFVFYILIFGSNSILHAQGASCSSAVSLTLNANPITGTANDTTVNDPTADEVLGVGTYYANIAAYTWTICPVPVVEETTADQLETQDIRETPLG